MAAISDITIKRTQDSLGKIIKKPVLTDKLLRKPPFKFLHDIINAVIQTTRFLDGLYSAEELQSDNIKDRDAKIAFLQKTIDVLQIVTKQEIRAKPSKIVTGAEADKTNELLQLLAKAIDRKLDTAEAVALVKNGKQLKDDKQKESKSNKTSSKIDSRKTSKNPKDATGTNKSGKNDLKHGGSKSTKISDGHGKAKKQDSTTTDESRVSHSKLSPQRDVETTSSAVNNIKSHEDVQKTTKSGLLQSQDEKSFPVHDKSTTPNRSAEKIQSRQSSGLVEGNETFSEAIRPQNEPVLETLPTTEVCELKISETVKVADDNEKAVETRKPQINTNENGVARQNSNESDKSRKNSLDGSKARKNSNETEKPKRNSSKDERILDNGNENVSAEKAGIEKPKSSSKAKKSESKNELEKSSEMPRIGKKSEKRGNEHPMEMSSKHVKDTNKPAKAGVALRSAAVRPVSARPSAPRRRDRNMKQILHTENFVQESTDQSINGKNNTLPEFDEDENVVITNAIEDNLSKFGESQPTPMPNDTSDKQGHLVQQILETQTAILKADGKNETTTNDVDESVFNDRNKSITRNTTELRKSIQKLSLYITPLGKMMEYFQEDVDAMQIELSMWQKAHTAAETEIKEEQRRTETQLEQFQYHLAEVNNSIREHTEQINSTTMNIIQNEEKITKLVSSL